MPARVTVIAGPARSGKTERALARYRQALARCRPGTTLWLAPTGRAAADVRGRLLGAGLCGCLGPAVMTFEQSAEAVLEFAPRPIRPLTRLMKRHLVRRLIDYIYTMLEPGGRVILGNFHPNNTDKAFMDHVLEWRLIHRTEDDMNRLFAESKFGRPCTRCRFEQECINLFAECVKEGDDRVH